MTIIISIIGNLLQNHIYNSWLLLWNTFIDIDKTLAKVNQWVVDCDNDFVLVCGVLGTRLFLFEMLTTSIYLGRIIFKQMLKGFIYPRSNILK